MHAGTRKKGRIGGMPQKQLSTQQERLMCLNTGGYSIDVRMRRFVLESEEKLLLRDLERVRAKLAKL